MMAVPAVRRRSTVNGRWGAVLLVLLLVTLFTPFSFRGWLLDYCFFLFAAAVGLSFLLLNEKTKILRGLSVALGVLLMISYVPLKALFGSRPVNAYSQDDLQYTLYEIPDMVAASQYFMEVTEPYLLFERRLCRSNVRPYCNAFAYDRERGELLAIDTCGTRSPSN